MNLFANPYIRSIAIQPVGEKMIKDGGIRNAAGGPAWIMCTAMLYRLARYEKQAEFIEKEGIA